MKDGTAYWLGQGSRLHVGAESLLRAEGYEY